MKNRYRNQAIRAYDTILANGGHSFLLNGFNISVDRIEQTIEQAVKKSGLNGYKCADAIIKMWDEQKKTIDAATE
jgi:hypothetical protein